MTSTAGLDDDLRERIDEVVDSAVRRRDAPGVVAALARGDEMHVHAAGAMSIGGPPMTRTTLFRISSNTKPITAAAILSLADEGLVDLDAPVDEFLPELADRRVLRRPDGPLADTVPARRPITTRDLLTFTWGLGMQGAMFEAAEPWPILTAALEAELGTFWDGGLGSTWSNVPDMDLTVVVLTQRAADSSGMPAVCDQVLAAARDFR